jgi:hypothetical protein
MHDTTIPDQPATLCGWCEQPGCTDDRHAQLYAESETRWRRIAERRMSEATR